MKPLHVIVLSTGLSLGLALGCGSLATAQENAPMVQKPSSLQQNGNSGTAPEGQGSTGWTGGTGGSFIGTQQQGSPSSPNDQPPVASGVDLKGPPVQEGNGKTPE
jgi:large exoprotein involved in heme utilization and adhesion